MKTIELWHGGRELEYSHREFVGSKKGRWEHGPGLYLTTHFDTARSYAKGGGKTYLVEVAEGNLINNTYIPIEMVNEFVSDNIIKNKQKILLSDIYDNMHRMNNKTHLNAEHLLNLVFNHEAISNSKTNKLNEILVNNGVDYGIVNHFKGRDETVLVIFNHKKIQQVKAIPSKEVSLEKWELDFSFKEKMTLKL